MRIEQIDAKHATPEQYAAINEFGNVIRTERMPDDPPIPLDEEIRRLQNIPPVVDLRVWVAWDGDRVAADGNVEILRTEENKHLVEGHINVRPEYRRRGLGTRLLAHLADAAAREGRTVMIGFTYGTIPAGEAFMRRLGATVGLETHTNQLDLRDLNRGLIPLWLERAKERASGFDLILWTNGYPEEDLAAISRVWDSMNRAPRGTLQMEDFHFTPEHVRDFARSDRERGNEVWSMVVRERATGNLAGFTEVSWHPNRPEVVQQRGTGVLAEYQDLGLGRWLKAAMLEKILRERPQVTRVRTGNADSNAPMLKINTELGFRPYISHHVWQIELAQVQAYLDSVRATKPAAPA
ncbi:MAG TPA: GNAT family N-acetyltransferase [bacterium]|nr:GNAT family N-acetyltransferase [bacterium]